MHKKVYIDGHFLLKSGIFYGLNFIMYANESYKNIADEIISCNADGIYEISEDSGSMFTEYYVKGGITMYGKNGSTIVIFKREHEDTFLKYKEIQSKIIRLLDEAIIPDDCINYFYQQQYISLIANLEYYLYGTLMWETCQNYDSYLKVINSLTNKDFNIKKEYKKIFKDEHNISQEIIFLKCISEIVYHRTKQLKFLFKNAFGVDVDFGIFENILEIRNNIVHRTGYTKEGELIQISKEQVFSLNDEIESLVEQITKQIAKFRESKFNPI